MFRTYWLAQEAESIELFPEEMKPMPVSIPEEEEEKEEETAEGEDQPKTGNIILYYVQ